MTDSDLRLCEMSHRIEHLEAAISDNIACIETVDDGQWNEFVGTTLLTEDQANIIRSAAKELKAALKHE